MSSPTIKAPVVFKGEALVIPFKLERKNATTCLYEAVDMTVAGRSVTMYLTPEGGSETEYTEAAHVTWTDEANGEGYWKWDEADVEDDTEFPLGRVYAVMWITDTTQVDPKRVIWESVIQVREAAGSGTI